MESMDNTLKKIQAEELLNRFRSKEDLYRYLVHQGKYITATVILHIVGLYLPSMEGTKISFMKAIMCNQKKALRAD